MWNHRHVTEKLDLLDPASKWRRDMKTVVEKFTEVLPHIRDLLCSNGDKEDEDELAVKFPRFSAALEKVILQLQSNLVELSQRKAEWESALKSRTGDIARADRQVLDLFEKTLKATKELESIQHKTDQERRALEPLQSQVKTAEAELHRAQERIRRLQDQEQSLLRREEELTERSQKFEDHRRAKEKDFEEKKSDMEQSRAEHQKVLEQFQSREISVGKTEEEQARAKINLEKTSFDMKSAHSVLKRLALITETGLDPSLASFEALADTVKEKYSNLQEACNTKQQRLDQEVRRSSGLEATLDSTMNTLRDTNKLHTDQMKEYENYKYQAISLESKVPELEKLQPLVNDLQLECARLRDANGTLDLSKQFSDQELAKCRANKAKQEQEFKKQLDDMTKANTDLTQSRANQARQVQDIKKQLDDMTKANTDLTQSRATQAKQVQDIKKQLDDMTKANTDLTQSRATQAKQVQDIKKQLDDMTKANTSLSQKLADRDAKIRHADQVTVDRDAKIGTFENHVRDMERQIQQLETQLTTKQEDARRIEEALRRDLQASQSDADTCKNDYRTVVEDRDRIAQDNDMLSSNLAQAIEINTKWEKSNKTLNSERTNLKKQLADAQRSCTAKDDQIGRISRDNQLLKSDTSKEVTNLSKTLQERSKELKTLQSSLEASHQKYADMNAEVESLKGQREALQSAAQRDREHFQNDLDSQTQIVADKDDEIKRLENDLRTKEKMCQSLSKQSDELKAGHGAAASGSHGLEQALDDFASTRDREVHDLKQELQKGQEANRTLQATIKRLETEKEKEVSQINTRLDELRKAYKDQANDYTAMETELSAKDKAIETLQHQLTQAQAENERFKRARIGDHTPSLGNGHGSEAQQGQTPGVSNSADNIDPDLQAGQQISGSLKRKADAMGSDSNTGQRSSGTGSGGGNNIAPGLNPNQQNPTAGNLSTWAIANIRDPTYVPDPPLPAEVLSTLRESLHEWDRRRADWAKPRIGRRCVESIVNKKASVWPHGEAVECAYCKKHKKLCMVVEQGSHLTLLPTYQGG